MSLNTIFTYVTCWVVVGVLSMGCASDKHLPSPDVSTTGVEAEIDNADHGCSYFYYLCGRHAELEAKFDEALEAYEKALICDPSAERVQRKIPLLLLRLDRFNEAVSHLESFIKDHPREKESRMLLAKVYLRQGKFLESSALYRKVHQLYPDDSTVLLLLSELYLTWNKPELAKVTLERTLAIDSQSYPAQVLFARLLVGNKEFSKASKYYQLALESNWSADLQLEMAETFVQQKKYDKAIILYQEILERDDVNEDARITLVHIYLEQHKEEQALAELNRLKAVTSRPEQVDLSIARLFARRGDLTKAIDILENILNKSNDSGARYLLAVLYVQTNNLEKALSAAQGIGPDGEEYDEAVFLQVRILRALEQDDQAIALLKSAITNERIRNPDMFVLLATLYQQNKKKKQGTEVFARAFEYYPDNEKLLYEYGLFLDTSGDQQRAMEVMQRVISLTPSHAGALNYVGYTWADQARHLNQALMYIQRAVKQKTDNGYILDSLGWVYFRLGRLTEAVATLRKAITLSPDDSAILEHLADVYLGAEKISEALDTYQKALDLSTEQRDRKRILDKIFSIKTKAKE